MFERIRGMVLYAEDKVYVQNYVSVLLQVQLSIY